MPTTLPVPALPASGGATPPDEIVAPVAALVASLGPARRGAKEKGIHRLRVATRRLDTWLRLAGVHVLRDDLGWLRGVAGPVRDLDVLLARPWPEATRAHLRISRARARSALIAGLDAPRLDALVLALGVLPPLRAAEAGRGARRFARALLEAPVAGDDLDDVHRRRRALRRLRYARELLGQPVEALVAAQDVLGRVSDLRLVRLHLPEAIDEPALAAALADADRAWKDLLPLLEQLA